MMSVSMVVLFFSLAHRLLLFMWLFCFSSQPFPVFVFCVFCVVVCHVLRFVSIRSSSFHAFVVFVVRFRFVSLRRPSYRSVSFRFAPFRFGTHRLTSKQG